MKISELLQKLEKPAFSVELMPEKGLSAIENLHKFGSLLQKKPLFVDIPFHPDFNSKNTQGVLLAVEESKRPSTEELSSALLTNYQLPPLAHLLCRNFTPEKTSNALLDLSEIGVENLLLLRGDKVENRGQVDFPGHTYAFELVKQLSEINRGNSSEKNLKQLKNKFCLGVAGYPEKHAEAPDYKTGILHLKQKQEAGADFILTQLFFDNATFFRFKEACIQAGISIPIIPAIGPLTTRKRLEQLPAFFHVSLPAALQNLISENQNEDALRETGIAWAKNQVRELLEAGEKLIHFYAFNDPAATEKIVQEFF